MLICVDISWSSCSCCACIIHCSCTGAGCASGGQLGGAATVCAWCSLMCLCNVYLSICWNSKNWINVKFIFACVLTSCGFWCWHPLILFTTPLLRVLSSRPPTLTYKVHLRRSERHRSHHPVGSRPAFGVRIELGSRDVEDHYADGTSKPRDALLRPRGGA